MTPETLDLFALVCALAGSLLGFAAWRRSRRLQEIDTDPFAEAGASGLRRLLAPLARALEPRSSEEREELTSLLLQAGRRNRDAVERFAEERALYVLMGFGLGTYLALSGSGITTLIGLACMAIGLYGPGKLVRSKAIERQDEITGALPIAVELLATCVAAGLSLEKAIARVGLSIEGASPILASELRVTCQELAVGVSMRDALRRLSRRVGLDEVSALCGVLSQAHALGAPIGGPLMEYAESSRRQQMSRLEEKAGKVTAKMTIPLTVFFLPVAMIIVLAPAALKIMRFMQ
jgi:tight adherence protein C